MRALRMPVVRMEDPDPSFTMPEVNLWSAVLYTYLEDAEKFSRMKDKERAKIEFNVLYRQASSKHVSHLCDLSGINHASLLKGMLRVFIGGDR